MTPTPSIGTYTRKKIAHHINNLVKQIRQRYDFCQFGCKGSTGQAKVFLCIVQDCTRICSLSLTYSRQFVLYGIHPTKTA
jgi:hypothetical protein